MTGLKSLALSLRSKGRLKDTLAHVARLAEAAQQLRSASSSSGRSSEEADPKASHRQLSGQTTLRQGGRMQTLKALLYIPGDRSTGNNETDGQACTKLCMMGSSTTGTASPRALPCS